MHMLTLIPLLTAVLGRTVAAQAATVPPGPISTASSPAPAVQLEAPQWTRVESRDKQPGEEWGGWGEVDWNTPFRFEFKKGYTTEKFTLYTYTETDEWHTDGSGGWLANRGPEPTPEHTLRCTIEAPAGGLTGHGSLMVVVSNKEPWIEYAEGSEVKASCEMEP